MWLILPSYQSFRSVTQHGTGGVAARAPQREAEPTRPRGRTEQHDADERATSGAHDVAGGAGCPEVMSDESSGRGYAPGCDGVRRLLFAHGAVRPGC